VTRSLAFSLVPEAWRTRTVAVHSLEDARDRDLVRRVADRDEDAFRTLFRRYGPVAKAVAVRLVRQGFMAEEIVQEAFLSLWRAPAAYREELGTFRAWLLSTVHHRAVDSIRREEAQRRRAADAPPDPVTEEDAGEVVVDRLQAQEARGQIRRAMADLPPAQRQILEMMYFDGKTQSVIAGELGLPLGTVKSRTLLGMRRLRASLLEEAP
jgi:RNA polymerase sigma-70 factor (ECF subfamily)